MAGRVALGLLLISIVALAEGARILTILPSGGKSHDIIATAFGRVLAGAGHDVTVITPYASKKLPKNYREIVLTGLLEKAMEGQGAPNFFDWKGGVIGSSFMLVMMYGMMPGKMYELAMEHPNVVNLLKSDEKFDVVLLESFITEQFYGLAQHFDAHLITFSAFGNSLWTNGLVGCPHPTSHLGHFLLSYTDRMTFWERFINTAFTEFDRIYYNWFYLPTQKKYYDLAFPNAKQSFEQQMKNVSLVFLNTHFTLSSPRPYPPNMIEVGGIQMDDPKPLPKDLKTYLDEATEGVVYFCMGSNIKSKDLPPVKRDAFLKAFGKLKQRVLWKFEDENLPNKPGNVKISPWVPQSDLLAHPNVKLFITHGGNLGTTESLYHGKPMVGIPIFGDQMMNIEKSVRAGYALRLDLDDISEETVGRAVNKVLNDPSYARNAKLVSDRLRDQPMTPRQTVVYWVEYVLRHGGAPQLRSPAMELSYLQYKSLDVYAVMLLLLVVIVATNVFLAKKLYRKVFRKSCPAGGKQKKA
ncbi:UDP-glycosyltransferase UGT5-like [Wyeomyia smithii]|uniref:UDP-glycosyltransferase UGT5-like n=1 Tax=Wyeomyia smithii TaxID=174621 RepID=UPI002467B1CC|nr:UDP-glycosyltransferase UGT5-like [Wyeomyia smithii]